MNLRIEQSGQDFLVIDPTEPAVPVDVYPTRAAAENFVQFIGQAPAGPLHWEHGEECVICGAPLYRESPGLCGDCKQHHSVTQ